MAINQVAMVRTRKLFTLSKINRNSRSRQDTSGVELKVNPDSNSSPNPLVNSSNDILVGDILKSARENLNIEIKAVAQYLRVRASDIKILESNDINNIAKNIYVPGLIKSYAKFLKIENKFIEEKIKELPLKSNTDIKKSSLINHRNSNDLQPSKDVYFNSMIAFVTLFIFFLIIFNLMEDNTQMVNTDLIIQDIQKLALDNV